MNTFLTALLVDLLDPLAAAGGLRRQPAIARASTSPARSRPAGWCATTACRTVPASAPWGARSRPTPTTRRSSGGSLRGATAGGWRPPWRPSTAIAPARASTAPGSRRGRPTSASTRAAIRTLPTSPSRCTCCRLLADGAAAGRPCALRSAPPGRRPGSGLGLLSHGAAGPDAAPDRPPARRLRAGAARVTDADAGAGAGDLGVRRPAAGAGTGTRARTRRRGTELGRCCASWPRTTSPCCERIRRSSTTTISPRRSPDTTGRRTSATRSGSGFS